MDVAVVFILSEHETFEIRFLLRIAGFSNSSLWLRIIDSYALLDINVDLIVPDMGHPHFWVLFVCTGAFEVALR